MMAVVGRNYGNLNAIEAQVLDGLIYGIDGDSLLGSYLCPTGLPPVITDTIGGLNQSIRHYVSLVTGLNVETNILKADQNAPTPKTPFATVKITPIGSVGLDAIVLTDEDDPDIDMLEDRTGVRMISASINFFQAGAMNYALTMQGSAYESANGDFLRARGLGFIRSSDVRDLVDIDLARWEERAQIEMFFYIIDENQNEVSSIQSQELDMTVDDYNNEFEVTE